MVKWIWKVEVQPINSRSTFSRFIEKVSPEPNSGCWLWVGSAQPSGHGTFWNGRKKEYAHRFSYKHFKGKIPKHLELDHLCRVTSCVNPDHLEAVTHKVNIHRSPIHNANKTHCKCGHVLSGNNLGHNPTTGQRICINCRRASQRRYYHRTYHPERNVRAAR